MKYTPLLLTLLLLGAGCQVTQPEPVAEPTHDATAHEVSMPAEEIMTPDVELFAELEDVTGGDASGTASLTWTEESEALIVTATFQDLPELEEGFFYEGWIVRPDPLNVISTGPLEREGSADWSNLFEASDDLSDHAKYILTLEPDDGDPAPADHVLDGTFSPLEQ